MDIYIVRPYNTKKNAFGTGVASLKLYSADIQSRKAYPIYERNADVTQMF